MPIYGNNDAPAAAAEEFLISGVVALDGTKTIAVRYANSVIKILSQDTAVSPVLSYINVPKNGYLYFIYDHVEFVSASDTKLVNRLLQIDAACP